MKKTIYGIVVAMLGAVLGAGAMFMFGFGKPAATAPVSAPTAAAPASAPVPAKTVDGASPATPIAANAAASAANKGVGAGAGQGGGGTPVELGKPEKLNWPKTVTAVGSLRSDESIIVRAEQSGRIVTLNFKEGQPDRKSVV